MRYLHASFLVLVLVVSHFLNALPQVVQVVEIFPSQVEDGVDLHKNHRSCRQELFFNHLLSGYVDQIITTIASEHQVWA